MIYITGDKHREFGDVKRFCRRFDTTKEDLMIVLGDAGINYCLNKSDEEYKRYLEKFPITFFIISGNHEERAGNIDSYEYVYSDRVGGYIWREPEYPSLLFADSTQYVIGGKPVFCINGAYSVDKYYRLEHGLRWFESEELTSDEMEAVRQRLAESSARGIRQHAILSHTCPRKYEPIDAYMSCIDQSKVSKRMEVFLEEVEETVDYDLWYCGHWHVNRKIDKMRFMFEDIDEFKV